MYDSSNESPKRLSQLTGAEAAFNAIVDYLTDRMSTVLGAEETEVRDQLTTFRPHFEQLYEGIVARHVGDSEMPELRKMLESERVQRYVQARRTMGENLVAKMRDLSHRMGETPV